MIVHVGPCDEWVSACGWISKCGPGGQGMPAAWSNGGIPSSNLVLCPPKRSFSVDHRMVQVDQVRVGWADTHAQGPSQEDIVDIYLRQVRPAPQRSSRHPRTSL